MIVHSTYNSVVIKWIHDKVSTGYHHCKHTQTPNKKEIVLSGALQPNIIAINMITLYAYFFYYFDSFHEKYLCQLASFFVYGVYLMLKCK